MAVPALVSQSTHGLDIIVASVFHSCRSPALELTWPITIIHCCCSRLPGCSKELALSVQGQFWESAFSGYKRFLSLPLWKLESDNPKTSVFSLENPQKNFFPPTGSSYQSLVDVFDNSEHQWFEEMTLACIGPQHGVFLQGLIFQDMSL